MRHPLSQKVIMSYTPYPSSGKAGKLGNSGGSVAAGPDRGPAPRSILNAVKLMYAGAAVSAIGVIIPLTDIGGLKSVIRKAKPHYDTAQVNHLANQLITQAIASAVIGILLWLWMAYANGKGKSWARIVASVFFAFNTITLIAFFRQPETGLGVVFEVLVWVVGLGAIVLLWRPESSAYFKPQPNDS
jgi:hypothetical protein